MSAAVRQIDFEEKQSQTTVCTVTV